MNDTTAAEVTTFSPDDFRKVGAEAQIHPDWLKAKDPMRGVTVRVAKVNQRTVDVESPHGRIIRIDPWGLVPAETPFVSEVSPDAPIVTVGTACRVQGRDGIYAVIALKDEAVNLARIGGENGRYLRSVPMSKVTAVNVTVTEVQA